MPTKPEPEKALVFNVSVKVSPAIMDALTILHEVNGTSQGQALREAFEDQIAGVGVMHDPGFNCIRDYRAEKQMKRIMNFNAWVKNWRKDHAEEVQEGV